MACPASDTMFHMSSHPYLNCCVEGHRPAAGLALTRGVETWDTERNLEDIQAPVQKLGLVIAFAGEVREVLQQAHCFRLHVLS